MRATRDRMERRTPRHRSSPEGERSVALAGLTARATERLTDANTGPESEPEPDGAAPEMRSPIVMDGRLAALEKTYGIR